MTRSVGDPGFLRPLLVPLVVLALALNSLLVAGETVLLGGLTLLPDGTIAEGLAVVIGDDGKITRVLPVAEAGEGTRRTLPAGSVLSPGLHDLLGGFAGGEGVERTHLFDPRARAVEAIDPTQETLSLARKSGVLHATVAPSAVNLVNGRTVTFICNTAETLAVLAEGPQVLALGESVFDPMREPTSRSGALLRLRQWLSSEAGERLLGEPLPPLVYCLEATDLRQVLSLFKGKPLPVLVHRGDARSSAGRWCRGALTVVGPFTVSTSGAEAMVCSRFQRAGAEIAFAGGLPGMAADSLRRTAAIAVSAGLDPAAARRGLTINP
ncbi:MAG TPA: hypothetical protein EYN79_00755, partial [Planctomycetes bacterium]|nr:hypothetical protein [Planctomycetota bacterium]